MIVLMTVAMKFLVVSMPQQLVTITMRALMIPVMTNPGAYTLRSFAMIITHVLTILATLISDVITKLLYVMMMMIVPPIIVILFLDAKLFLSLVTTTMNVLMIPATLKLAVFLHPLFVMMIMIVRQMDVTPALDVPF
jgi:hypothetical protein